MRTKNIFELQQWYRSFKISTFHDAGVYNIGLQTPFLTFVLRAVIYPGYSRPRK